MCRGEMKSSLGVVEIGILHLRLSRGLDARGCRPLRRRSVMPWWRWGLYATTVPLPLFPVGPLLVTRSRQLPLRHLGQPDLTPIFPQFHRRNPRTLTSMPFPSCSANSVPPLNIAEFMLSHSPSLPLAISNSPLY